MLDVSKVKKWYKMKLWNKDMLVDAVKKGNLTAESYTEITGEEYIAE